MSLSISTQDFKKSVEVEIDGMEWEFISPGAGLMLDLSRLSRKITSKSATPEEEAEMVDLMLEYYGAIFKDSTEDNSQVTEWLRKTPVETVGAIVKDIQEKTK